MTQDSASPSRRLTFQTVMSSVLEKAPISRAELARLTGLSKQTISQTVHDLETDGWLRTTGTTVGGPGRNAVTYEFAGGQGYILGIDLGGTKLHAALSDLDGTVVGERVAETDARGGMHVVEQMALIAGSLVSEAGVVAGAAGVGVPGAVDPLDGAITMVPNIAEFETLPVCEMLEERLGCGVVLDNDVNMAARGELWSGKDRARDFAFVALGTGIGLGLVSGGRVIRGAAGKAGEIMHLPIGGDSFDTRNFASGTLEGAVGSAAILGRYRSLDGDARNVRDMFDRIAIKDAAAIRTVDEIARLVAQVVLTLSAVTAPESVIFGGSVGTRRELVDRISHHLAGCMAEPVPCSISALGSRAAVIGALAAARERVLRSTFDFTEPAMTKALLAETGVSRP